MLSGGGEMAQQLRIAILSEDLSSVSTLGISQLPIASVPVDRTPSYGLLGYCTHGAYTQIQIYISTHNCKHEIMFLDLTDNFMTGLVINRILRIVELLVICSKELV